MLSEKQKEAIQQSKGAVLVVAGPGSGKTTVLTRRVQYLLESTQPERILVITFARKAAEEMRQRFAQMAGEEVAARVEFGTFHSVFYRWLRRWKVLTADHQILEEEQREALWKQLGWDMEDVPAFLLANRDAAHLYQQEKKRRGLVDFEDLIELTLKEIGKYEMWREYDYVLIDEFQDINQKQYEIVRHIVNPVNPNLFVVGDEDQAIYAFRGAKPELFLRFADDFTGCTRIDLTLNFRSQEKIVTAAQELIQHNQKRFDKVMKASQKGTYDVKLYTVSDDKEEAVLIRNQLEQMHHKGIGYQEMAVLCRTKAQMGRIGAAMEEAGIPYESKEVLYKADHEELLIWQDLDLFWRLSRNPADLKAFREMLRILPVLMQAGNWRRVPEGEAILRSLLAQPMEAAVRQELLELEKRLRQGGSMKKERAFLYWLLQTDYLTYAYQKRKQRGLTRRQMWSQVSEKYREQSQKVLLSTMHGAKGLEFDLVWVAGLVEGECPRKEAIEAERVEEERRLLYVAMTRARKRLFLSTYDGIGAKPSRFLSEIKSLQRVR